MLRITAAHADEWNTWGAPELAGAGVTKLLAACERVGRDPATMRKCAQALVIVTDDSEVVERARAGGMAARTLAGSIDQIVDQVAGYVDRGFDEFIVPDWASPTISTPATVCSSTSSPPSPPPTADRQPRLRRDFRGPGHGNPDANGIWPNRLLASVATSLSETVRGSRSPRRRAGSSCARRSSSDARFTALTPPIALRQLLLPGLAEPGDAVERARRHALAAPFAVERVGEAVRLVTDPLQHEQRLAAARDLDRLGPAGMYTSSNRFARPATGISSVSPSSSITRLATRELTLAAVDEQQLRRVGELARLARRAR